MKLSISAAILTATLFLVPIAHAQTGTMPIGNPETDTLQLWGSITSSIDVIAQEAMFAAGQITSAIQELTSTVAAPHFFQTSNPTPQASGASAQSAPLATAVSSFDAPNVTSSTSPASQPNAQTGNQPSNQPIIERVTEYEPFATEGYVTQNELTTQLQLLSDRPNSRIATTTTSTQNAVPQNVAADGNPDIPYAAENAIENLSNVTITNANLTASEIPALDYLSLSGGTLTGDLDLSGNATSSNLAVSGTASTSNLVVSNSFTLGTLTGILHAVSGVISSSLVNLTADVTGVLPVANGGTGWASLAAGYIPFGNGSSALATSTNLYWDNANGRLGIGTTSPFTTLAVNGNAFFNGNLTATNYYGNISSSTALATGGTTARALGDIAADVVNVKSFGATGNGVTNDSAAINAAISYIRNGDDAAGAGVINKYELFFPQGNYLIDNTINLTCYSDPNGTILSTDDGCRPNGGSSETSENHSFLPVVGFGARLTCSTSGTPCIDGMGSRYVQIQGLTVYGSCTSASEPSWGVQIGRTVSGNGADDWYFHSVDFTGCYNKAAYYNLASEDTSIDGDSWFQNFDTNNTFSTSTGPYVAVWDSGNHWQVTSAFVTNSIPQDSTNSFNDNTVTGGSFYPSSPTSHSGGLWIYGTRRLRFIDTYIVTNQSSCINIYFDATSGGSTSATSDHSPENDQFDIHCEGTVAHEFLITGAQTNPIIKGLEFSDEAVAPQKTGATVFALDSGVVGLTLQNVSMNVVGGGTSISLWDTPSAYTVSGDIYLPASGRITWTTPGTWTGCVYIGTASPSCGGLTSSGVLNITSLTGGALDFDGLSQLYASSTISSLFLGYQAGSNLLSIATSSSITSGPFSVAIGQGALKNATSSAYESTAIGYDALLGNASTGGLNANGLIGQNTAIGWDALLNYTNGYENTAVGSKALGGVTSGTINVGVGLNAGLGITTGSQNVAIGNQVMSQHGGSLNVAIGNVALQGNGTGFYNVAIGSGAGNADTSGANNIFLGTSAASTTATGNNNITLGYDIALPSANGSNQLDIGNLVFGTVINGEGTTVSTGNLGIGTTTPYSRLEVWGPDTASTSAFTVANSASTTEFSVYDTGNAVLAGGLTQNSDQRLKTNIQSLAASSSLAAIDALNPVTFNWIDPDKGTTPQLGFIAQQVLPIFPNLVSTTSATALTPDGTLSLNYIDLISPIVSAIQSLSSQLSSIESTIASFANSFTTQELTFNRATGQQLCLQKSDGTPVCLTGDQLAAVLAGAAQSSSGANNGNSSSSAIATDTPPIIQINGDNPAIVQVGDTYNDLGVTITGPTADLNLGITTYVNGIETSPVQIDTSAAATDTIDYVATDQNGLAATSTRVLIIGPSPSIVPTDNASTTADNTNTGGGNTADTDGSASSTDATTTVQ